MVTEKIVFGKLDKDQKGMLLNYLEKENALLNSKEKEVKKIVVKSIDELYKSQVKGFIRTKKGKLERVNPFVRNGRLTEAGKQHNKNVRYAIEYWFDDPVGSAKIAGIKTKYPNESSFASLESKPASWGEWTWDEAADDYLAEFKQAIKNNPEAAKMLAKKYYAKDEAYIKQLKEKYGPTGKPKKFVDPEVAAKQKEFKKYGITARKYGGDDAYSWAVFKDGRPVMTGLGHSEVAYYKKQVLESAKGKGE